MNENWVLDMSPLQLNLFFEMGKADQRMDFLSYDLTLGNMNRTKSNERIWMGKISLVLMFPRLTEEGVIQLYKAVLAIFSLASFIIHQDPY